MENDVKLPIYESILEGNLKTIRNAVQGALDAEVSPSDVLNVMTDAMNQVGEQFRKNEIFVPEMLVSAKTMQRGIGVLEPYIDKNELKPNGSFIIGTVAGDLHDIGKNLVALMVSTAGYTIVDLGVDVPTERFLQALEDHPDCKLVGLSALLTTTLNQMKETVEAIHLAYPEVKVLVGGAPVTEEFAKSIGADAFTKDAAEAAFIAAELGKEASK